MSEPIHDPELAAFETALAGLAPRPGPINRDQLLFRAGQQSARRYTWFWPCSSGVLALATAVLAGVLWLRSAPQPVERIVYVPVPVTPPPAADTPAPVGDPSTLAAGEADERVRAQVASLRLRDRIVTAGVDVIPPAPTASAPDPSPPLERLLGVPADALRPYLPRKPGDHS
jgi:hypothetical protein